MIVGINYPWYRYGWDFGLPVAGWGRRAAWRSVIDQDLSALRGAGVQIVRWFVLGDGITYGTGRRAPHRSGQRWRFDQMPRIDPEVEADFQTLLRRFRAAEMKLLPVLLDFKWVYPGLDRSTTDRATLERWYPGVRGEAPDGARLAEARERARRIPEGYVKGGRADVVYDERKHSRFFRRVLGPLLQISRRFREQIFAWELINEPEWVTRQPGLGGSVPDSQRIPLARMLRFIHDGLEVIRDHGFRPTVGFARPLALADWDARDVHGAPATPAYGHLGLGTNQIHYYPRRATDDLRSAAFGNGMPTVLGELSSRVQGLTAHATDTCAGSRWPELANDRQDLAHRLSLASVRGYQAAMPWSYRGQDCATEPDRAATVTALGEYPLADEAPASAGEGTDGPAASGKE